MNTQSLTEISSHEAATPIRVLILEHEARDIELILFELREARLLIEHTLAADKEQFLQAIRATEFEAILADYRLPNWTGLDALRELQNEGKDIPFLLVTGTLGEEAAVECMKNGVSDYILKDHISRLPLALKRALREKALRRETEAAIEALRSSEVRNRNLVENAVYGICRLDAHERILDANPAFLRILGCESPNEMKSFNKIRDVFRFPEQHAQLFASCRQEGHLHGAETEWRRLDGGIVAVRLTLRLMRISESGGEIEIIAEDVTELRAMERQLRQAQKFEAIGQLAGGIAHDFNNVVGAILGWAELGFEQNQNNPQAVERFRRIREQAERAAALTRELLAFARRQVLQPRAVDLNSVTSGLLSFLDKVLDKDIELKVVTSPLDPVRADPTQIEQVLMNLCINARDAMPDGGRLVIETEMVELDDSYCRFYPGITAGRYAVFSVSDTGIGMDSETRERIFEPFFTTKELGKGTGMGLATVYGIVKQHEGFVHVYSEPGQGTLFRVYLPVMAVQIAATGTPAAPAPSLADIRGTETILIAEDHESIREMARQTLMGLGYRVLSAENGEEALLLCQNEAPSLAVLDVVMPEMGGVATSVKLAERFPGLPVVFTSGYSRDPANDGSTEPEHRYLQKPYSPTTLGRLVREILDEQGRKNGPGD
jgi:PAS domain S-box-containing protein